MTLRPTLLFCLAMALPSAASSQEASIIELVEECDILAAHPDDPQRMADGIADDAIVPRLAVLACEEAIERDPDDPRFTFQLGRALLAANDEKKAVESFKKAADAGYAAAWAYLGDAYQFGLGTDVEGHKSLSAYKKALDGGFKQAEDQIKQLQFDASMYARPFAKLFYDGNYAEIRTLSDGSSGSLNRNYVFNFIQSLLQECEPFVQPDNVASLYSYRYPPNWKAEQDDNVIVAIQTSVAEYDASTFLRRHVCGGLIAKHVFKSINLFLGENP